MEERRIVLITGSNGGIGRALVQKFAQEKYMVLAHARKQTEDFERYITTVADERNTAVVPVYFDLCDSESIKKEFRRIHKEYRKIDVLVNNAGVAHGGFLQMTSIADIKRVFEVNYFSLCEVTQCALRLMSKSADGAIINMASVSGLDSRAGNCAYGASKAAVIELTKTLAQEVAKLGIRVNAIAPGLTGTQMADMMEEKAGDAMIRDTAMGRLGKTEEIADLAVYLASEKASFITGQVVRIDGGM